MAWSIWTWSGQASIRRSYRSSPYHSCLSLICRRTGSFLKYTLPPLFLLLLLVFIAPSFIIKPTERIIYYNKEFAREIPYQLIILNNKLEAFQQEDFILKVKVSGEVIPEELLLETEGATFKMKKESKVLFSYTFKTLQKSTSFRLAAGKYRTEEYEIKVFPRPTILSYDISLNYPSYINRRDELLENTGDIIIPEGTKVTWKIYTKDVDKLTMRLDTATKILERSNENIFECSSSFFRSIRYSIQATNSFVKKNDSLSYGITVIPDAFPTITVTESKDTLLKSHLYFQGVIKDDYGFSRLTFNYTVAYNGDTTHKMSRSDLLQINKNLNQQQFYYSTDLSQMIKNPGDQHGFLFRGVR